MAFVDEYKFTARAGKGGDGVVRWRREKFIPKGGPVGGDGGKGGDVYVRGVRNISLLGKIIQKDRYAAEDGEAGGSNSKHGGNGAALTIDLPIGSIVTNADTGERIELLKEGESVRLLTGGRGGFGNEHFKSATNQRPMEATKGALGEAGRFTVELKLIADIGLVGLPNAGKTSLLNALTNAGAKVGDYPFTTLDPNLGVYHGLIIADIPGIIEGASEGKGLGYKFLRHISRTNIVLHCISLEQDTLENIYKTVRNEIISHSTELQEKREFIVLTKSDLVSAEVVENSIKTLNGMGLEVLPPVSILDDQSIKVLGDSLTQIFRSKI